MPTREELEELFDRQVAHAENICFPRVHTKLLSAMREKVIAAALSEKIPDGHIPFLPVFPGAFEEFAKALGGLEPRKVVDLLDSRPKKPYFIVCVEDGSATLGQSPGMASGRIEHDLQNLCLTANEALNMAWFCPVLEKHGIFAAASRYCQSDRIISVFQKTFLSEAKMTRIDHRSFFSECADFGTPSCKMRVF